MASSHDNTIALLSSDAKEFIVDGRSTARRMIKREISGSISVPYCDSYVLEKIIEYCYMHADGTMSEALNSWDANFMQAFDDDALCDLLYAANYLEIKGLITLTILTLRNLKDLREEEEREREEKELARNRRRKRLAGCAMCFPLIGALLLLGFLAYYIYVTYVESTNGM